MSKPDFKVAIEVFTRGKDTFHVYKSDDNQLIETHKFYYSESLICNWHGKEFVSSPYGMATYKQPLMYRLEAHSSFVEREGSGGLWRWRVNCMPGKVAYMQITLYIRDTYGCFKDFFIKINDRVIINGDTRLSCNTFAEKTYPFYYDGLLQLEDDAIIIINVPKQGRKERELVPPWVSSDYDNLGLDIASQDPLDYNSDASEYWQHMIDSSSDDDDFC